MDETDKKRISRLTAILTQLQTTRILTAQNLSEKFNVSKRTIYRDIKALEQAGIPIVTEEGKGYSIMEHYRLSPVAFTENEANALITAEQLIKKNKDTSLVKEYTQAIAKIKSVLNYSTREKANLLSERVLFNEKNKSKPTSQNLLNIQFAITNYILTEIEYSNEKNSKTFRIIEPFALYHTEQKWLLIAFCRLRMEFRIFRTDRISKLNFTEKFFEPHQMSIDEYFQKFY